MKAVWNKFMNGGEMEVFEDNMIDYTVWDLEEIKKYWMATMAIEESREQMEEIWSTEVGMADMEGWLNGEIECGLTHDEMVEVISEYEEMERTRRAEQDAREWVQMTKDETVEEVAGTIYAIHEGYRCEQEIVPEHILEWAIAHME